MRRSWLLIGLLVSVGAAARSRSMVELSLGGTYTSLGYGLAAIDQPLLRATDIGSPAFSAHVGYTWLFSRTLGIGVGCDIARYGSDARLSGTVRWPGVSDTDDEVYDHQVQIQSWSDRQSVYLLEIPLMLVWRAPVMERSHVSAALGVKVAIPITRMAAYRGDITHSGMYTPWQLELTDMSVHGFYSSTMQTNYTFSTQPAVAALAKVGWETAVDDNRRVSVFGHITGTYFITSPIRPTESPKYLGFRNDTQDLIMQQTHTFMTAYTSIIDTRLVRSQAIPWSVGLEIGVRLIIPHTHYTCRCTE